MLTFIVIVILALSAIAYITNPFSKFTYIRQLCDVVAKDGKIQINELSNIKVRYRFYWRQLFRIVSGWLIVSNRLAGSQKAQSHNIDQIIKEIHEVRFNPNNLYLISGDHFSVFYPRSLGIFYHSILDPRTALNKKDWEMKQQIYLKSLYYALRVYSKTDELSTTIVPVTPHSTVLINFYATPSDTLYSLLYAFDQLIGSTSLSKTYPFDSDHHYQITTTDATRTLFTEFKQILHNHLKTYARHVYDESTGFVRKDILLSGTKDISKRSGAFYDNVTFWKTLQLAHTLDLQKKDIDLEEYKERIIKSFWNSDGFFYEDMSTEARKDNWYSSDWLIAYQVGMLQPSVKQDREMLIKAVDYIQQNKIDEPFPLRYHNDVRSNRLYGPVRFAAPTYGSTTIWSHWGIEYIKLLLHLAQATKDISYLKSARKHLDTYAFNISRYRGYPELYNSFGDLYSSFAYKSVRRTGWVVSFEQAQKMYSYTSKLLD